MYIQSRRKRERGKANGTVKQIDSTTCTIPGTILYFSGSHLLSAGFTRAIPLSAQQARKEIGPATELIGFAEGTTDREFAVGGIRGGKSLPIR